MTHFFDSFDEYFSTEQRVSVRALDLGGVIVSQLEESSNDIAVASVNKDAVLVSLSGSEHHSVRFGGVRRDAPTAEGDVALVPKGVALQSSWRVRSRNLKTLSLEFGPDLFFQYTPEILSGPFSAGHLVPATYGQRSNLASISLLLMREMDAAEARGKLFSDSVNRLLALELAAKHWSVPTNASPQVSRTDQRVRRAIDFIEAHLTSDIAVVDIAAAAALSVTALTAQLRLATGLSPYAYVIERRICLAERLLRSSDMPIAQVALAAGFVDQSHLTRAIRSHRGRTPRQIKLDH